MNGDSKMMEILLDIKAKTVESNTILRELKEKTEDQEHRIRKIENWVARHDAVVKRLYKVLAGVLSFISALFIAITSKLRW